MWPIFRVALVTTNQLGGCQQSGTEATPSRKSSLVSASNLPDWTLSSTVGEHLWNDCPNSTEVCHLSDECGRSGAKRKCSVCRIICHARCIETLKISCRPTFREADIREYRDEEKKSSVPHHWVGRRRQESKCKTCAKSIQTMFAFTSKDMVAMQCTWCKASYHNRPSCFSDAVRTETCNLGAHASLIVPPNWIIKMPKKNDFKSSIRRASSVVYSFERTIPNSCLCTSSSRPENLSAVTTRLTHSSVTGNGVTTIAMTAPEAVTAAEEEEVARTTSPVLIAEVAHGDRAKLSTIPISSELHRISPSLRTSTLALSAQLPFVIKSNPLDAGKLKPLLVFINPRSGGNQGSVLLRKFQWILNPRQIFDLSQGGPRMGLELFNRVPNLRILACGGDGTVGWVFSTIDELKMNPTPPVAVLPLGTGNDLARTLRWGAGYADEPISKLLRSIEQGSVVALDRWQVDCTPLMDIPSTNDLDEGESARHRTVSSNLPLRVFNNYFSLGADAATALEFHESREANPERFNSRLKNKIFYAGCGGRDLLLRSWRDLCDHITLECDGKDLTPLIRSIRPHVILFLNIPRYGSGTLPWGQAPPAAGFEQPRIDDGLIEVIGLSSTTLAMIQVGGHGDRICQCRTVTLTTDKVIPMQMDGEPCRLMPATIQIRCSHQALVVQKQGHQPTYTTR
ncbi:Diacylglycerol kinase [Fasciola hepatica]|uniref:Diacylglycerol kinase n=1 Tax=Fasciola hepatica TaxID=6192 RepID=A0A4E0S3Z9_FASHE|nr:Diacylglycerol kinase [Fasciola hepatica]